MSTKKQPNMGVKRTPKNAKRLAAKMAAKMAAKVKTARNPLVPQRGGAVNRHRDNPDRALSRGEYSREQNLFIAAVAQAKAEGGVSFIAYTDILRLIRLLGYRKVQKTAVPIRMAEDFQEGEDTPHGYTLPAPGKFLPPSTPVVIS
jgi:hypothetical protein